jgi:pimeloyl-ACP methyl ester carboxylesterase
MRATTVAPANDAFRRGDDTLAATIMTGGINGAATSSMPSEAMARRMQNIQAMKMLALSSDEFPWIAPSALAALPMPVLMMAGRNTPPIHAEIFRNVCRAMPQAQVQWIDDAGHGASRDNPAQFNRFTLDFLEHHAADLAT